MARPPTGSAPACLPLGPTPASLFVRAGVVGSPERGDFGAIDSPRAGRVVAGPRARVRDLSGDMPVRLGSCSWAARERARSMAGSAAPPPPADLAHASMPALTCFHTATMTFMRTHQCTDWLGSMPKTGVNTRKVLYRKERQGSRRCGSKIRGGRDGRGGRRR